ncbi:MAG: hypothetical protein ACTSVI_15045 [Promethearchaeota archaeon]
MRQIRFKSTIIFLTSGLLHEWGFNGGGILNDVMYKMFLEFENVLEEKVQSNMFYKNCRA